MKNENVCKICGFEGKSRQSVIAHVRHNHGVVSVEYQYNYEKLHRKCPTCHKNLTLEEVKDRFRPGIKLIHCSKKCSFLAKAENKEFYQVKYGLSEEEAQTKVTAEVKRRIPYTPAMKEYWIKKGFSKKEAKQQVKAAQTKTSLEAFIYKYGKEEGNFRYERHCKNISLRYSGKGNPRYGVKLSENLKEKISKQVKALSLVEAHRQNVFEGYLNADLTKFGTSPLEYDVLNRLEDLDILCEHQFPLFIDSDFVKENSEYSNKIVYVYDLKVINKPIIIEVYGWYIHADPLRFKSEEVLSYKGGSFLAKDKWKRDALKNHYAKTKGYAVHIVWEHDDLQDQLTNIKESINANC